MNEVVPVRSLWVPGKAVAQGSKQAVVRPNGSIAVLEQRSSRDALAAYRADIREAWHRAVGVGWSMTGAMAVTIVVYRQRPKSHFDSKGRVRPSALNRPKGKPDADKHARAVLDALTGHAYVDDAQVSDLHVVKAWAESEGPGTRITIWDLDHNVLAPTVPTP